MAQSKEEAVKAQAFTDRVQRRREDAVRRLVVDVTRLPSTHSAANASVDVLKSSSLDEPTGGDAVDPVLGSSRVSDVPTASQASVSAIGGFTKMPDDALLTSAVAVSIERGIDRELHNELVRQARESAGVISKICHDHSDAFLGSVGRVVALGGPCGELRGKVEEVRKREWGCIYILCISKTAVDSPPLF